MNIQLTLEEAQLIIGSLDDSQVRIINTLKYAFLPKTVEKKRKELECYRLLVSKLSRCTLEVLNEKLSPKKLSSKKLSPWWEDCIGRIVDPDEWANCNL